MRNLISRLAVLAAPIVYLWGASAPANATLNASVGNISLQQNQANQNVSLTLTGGDLLNGVNLYLQIDDGEGINTPAPAIQSVDMLTSTIFSSGSGYVQTPIDTSSAYLQAYSLDGDTTVTGSGTWLRMVLDTTGVPAGTYPFLIKGISVNSNTFNTSFVNGASTVSSTVSNGTLTIVPEPSFLGIAFSAGALLVACRRRA